MSGVHYKVKHINKPEADEALVTKFLCKLQPSYLEKLKWIFLKRSSSFSYISTLT